MYPLGILYGIATFYGIKKIKRPARKMAVMTTSQLFNTLDQTREVAYSLKEEMEDIIAEAHYENMKKNHDFMSDSTENLNSEGVFDDWTEEDIVDYLQNEE